MKALPIRSCSLQGAIASLAVFGLVLSASGPAQAQDASHSETRSTSVTLEDLQPTLGSWQVTNWLVTGPGQMEEHAFTIHIAEDLGAGACGLTGFPWKANMLERSCRPCAPTVTGWTSSITRSRRIAG